MCGIVGYVGPGDAVAVLIDGLKRLEYRGYDSCGIAIAGNGSIETRRAAGCISGLEALVGQNGFGHGETQRAGVGHTRWATHGRPTEENAHPHQDCTGEFVVVHNGIIENHTELRRRLVDEGHLFRTSTDTEILPHLIEKYFNGCLEDAVARALEDVDGVYGLVVVSSRDKGKLVVTRRGAPIVIGLGNGENFVASDIPALLPRTKNLIFLEDGDIGVIAPGGVRLRDRAGAAVSRPHQRVEMDAESAERAGYEHFMLKEIHEQPAVIRNTVLGRVDRNGRVCLDDELGRVDAFKAIQRIRIAACGTSLHAGLIGKFMIESMTDLPVEVDYASELRYRKMPPSRGECVIAITQSGETADTLAAAEEARRRGAFLITICNAVGSQASRISDRVLYTRAGLEIAVASTKAFTSQVAVLYLLGLYLGQVRGCLSNAEVVEATSALAAIPGQMERILERPKTIEEVAARFAGAEDFLYLGRSVSYPIALEGALKLKEISYIHAEGYPAGEMKHGPIALVDPDMPVVVVAPKDHVYAKILSNVEEARARDGYVIGVGDDEDGLGGTCDYVLPVPKTAPLLSPLLTVLPLQILAYEAAVIRGNDVDKPRNLAKSVTVE